MNLEGKNIIDFCNDNKISWQPVLLKISKDEKVPIPFSNGILPKTNDIKMKKDLTKTHYLLDQTDYIAIYTDKIQQLDVDSKDFIYETDFEHIKNCPYYLSCTKNLPHYFMYCDSEKDKTPIKNGDLLTGCWSFALKNSKVFNFNNQIQSFKVKQFPVTKIDKNKQKFDLKIKGYIDQLKLVEGSDNASGTPALWFPIINSLYRFAIENNCSDLEAKEYATLFSKDSKKYNAGAKSSICNLDKTSFKADPEKYIKKLLKQNEQKEIINQTDNIDEYEKIKEEFQKNNFYCIADSHYYKIMGKNILKKTRQEFISMYEQMTFPIYDPKTGKFIRDDQFIYAWFKDNKRTYDDIGCYPTGLDCPDNIFNSFLGFEVEDVPNIFCDEDYEDFEFMKIHLFNLCDKNEEVYCYSKYWFNALYTFPGKKNQVALFYTGEQGTHKDNFFDFNESIMGSRYCNKDVEPEVFLGKFNDSSEDKILILFNEVNCTKICPYIEQLNQLISNKNRNIQGKNLKIAKKQNFCHCIFYSNEQLPIKFNNDGDKVRRYLFIRSKMKTSNKQYTDKIVKAIYNKKCQKLWYNWIISDENKLPQNMNWIDNLPITQLSLLIENCSATDELSFLNKYICDQMDHFDKSITKENPNGDISLLSFSKSPSELFEEFRQFCRTTKVKLPDFGKNLCRLITNKKIDHITHNGKDNRPLYIFNIPNPNIKIDVNSFINL